VRRKVYSGIDTDLLEATLLVRGRNSWEGVSRRNSSCETETPRKGFSEELLVRGGEYSHGGNSWEGVSRRNSSCETEAPRKGFSEELLVRGGEYSCEVERSHANEPTPRNSSATEK
jgi:hypothetical protein